MRLGQPRYREPSQAIPRMHWRDTSVGGKQARLLHGPRTLSVRRNTAVGWFLALLEMLARFMDDAQAMSRAVRWGDAAYIEDMVERGRKIRRSLIELKQA